MQFVFMFDPDSTASVCHVLAWMNSATECKLLMGLLCTACKGMILWLPMQRHTKNPPFLGPGGPWASQVVLVVKNSSANARDIRDTGLIPGSEWQAIPVFLLGESHGQRRVVGYSPWGHKSQIQFMTK